MQEVHSSFTFMYVPKVFPHLTRKRVLTMEWMVGESPTDLLSVTAGNTVGNVSEYSERQKLDAKRRLLDLVCKQKCNYPLFVFTLCKSIVYLGC